MSTVIQTLNMKHSIRTRILAILGMLAMGYLLLLALEQISANATRALWALRIFVLVVSAMVIYTFIEQVS